MKNKIIIRLIIGGIIFFSIVLIALIIVYFTTEIFKPAHTLFEKYFEKEINNISQTLDISQEQLYLNNLQQKSYNDNTSLEVTYTTSMDTNEIFNIQVTGETESQTKKTYRKANIKYGENVDVANIEFLQENNQYGLLFSDAVQQYATIEAATPNDIYSILSINNEEIDSFIYKYKIRDILALLGEKKQTIIKTITDFKQELENKQYTIRKNRGITLSNGSSITTRAITLNLSSSQTKKLAREILKQLADDQTLNEVNSRTDEFPALTITLYTVEGKTARIGLEIGNRTLKIDLYENETNVDYTFQQGELYEEKTLNYKNSNGTRTVNYKDNKNNNIEVQLTANLTELGQTANGFITIKNDNIKNVNINISQNIEFSENTKTSKTFNDVKSISLSSLDANRLNASLNSLISMLNTHLKIVQNSNINSELLGKWIDFNQTLQEKYATLQNNKENRFNTQFLTYQGRNVDKNVVNNLLDVAGRNIYGYSKNNKNELKIYLQEGNIDEKITEEMKEVVKAGNNNYNINFEFDQNGKISLIFLEQYVAPNNN